ncbi:hypothetical protein, partial [Bradyrhizobium sp.]|uniref:hypothetical protein n=1 Tax=Bradyrhizobium sp. TaxID=376 RepID=UPI003C476331
MLDFLKRNAALQPMPSGLPSDQAQYGATPVNSAMAQAPIGMSAAPAQPMPPATAPAPIPQQPPAVIPAQPAPAPAADPLQPLANVFNRGADALGSISRRGSLLGAVRGQYDDPTSQGAAAQNVTARALISKGVDPKIAVAAVQPGNTDLLKTLIAQSFGPHQAQILGQGWIRDPQTGQVTRAYTPEQNDNYVPVQTGENELGKKVFQKMNKATGETTPFVDPSAGGTDDNGALPANAHGTSGLMDALDQMRDAGASRDDLYKAAAGNPLLPIAQAMIEGRAIPRNLSNRGDARNNAVMLAHAIDPSFDETSIGERQKYRLELGSNGASTAGGQSKAFIQGTSHLDSLASTLEKLDNSNGLGIPWVAQGVNAMSQGIS